ncbi:retropepsin-like domain-containing protein [Fibrella forsythiae]|uniref:Retropepsin-like domain-containing protein n=1 Tax=Fibrella forsythiae TaxID=2817061 RepID=A0ABS3JTE4_9BACT|nr:retropepsin-like domain-containing protein [Fibrella forsythiae]MBO0953276.1 retropepsin-like domain-containing protein [Fibrella forsythiae]
MKIILSFLISLNCCVCFSQKALPIIKAHSNQATIHGQYNSVSRWHINPKLKLDVFTTGKLTKPTTMKFKTDIDSVSFKIKPGQKKDFIVLLNDKDSCLTRIQCLETRNFSKLSPEIHDSIPFFINSYNTNFLRVVFDETDSLILNFDTGANEVALTNDALKTKFKARPKLYTTDYRLQIGNTLYKSKVHDIELAGHETDGLLGWDNFDGMIVELNYDHNKLIVYSKMPKQILRDKQYEAFEIRYIDNKPYIKSELQQSGINSKDWFLFDLGYVRTVMLDNNLLKESRIPVRDMKVLKKVIMHDVSGHEIPVITAALEVLKIGSFKLTNVPAQLLPPSNPIRGINTHILGNDILKRFNTILDFQKNVVYLKPNKLYHDNFADQKKSGA